MRLAAAGDPDASRGGEAQKPPLKKKNPGGGAGMSGASSGDKDPEIGNTRGGAAEQGLPKPPGSLSAMSRRVVLGKVTNRVLENPDWRQGAEPRCGTQARGLFTAIGPRDTKKNKHSTNEK